MEICHVSVRKGRFFPDSDSPAVVNMVISVNSSPVIDDLPVDPRIKIVSTVATEYPHVLRQLAGGLSDQSVSHDRDADGHFKFRRC